MSMSTTTRTLPPLPFVATCGLDCVAQAATLAELLATLGAIFEPWLGEDVVLWWGQLVVAVWTNEGKRLELLRPSGHQDDFPRPAA
jgi:hypothetical protein